MYRPRLFIVEAGNSFGLIGDLAKRLTEPEEKKERYDVMQSLGLNELDAAMHIAARIVRLHGIEPHSITFPAPTPTGIPVHFRILERNARPMAVASGRPVKSANDSTMSTLAESSLNTRSQLG